MTDSIQPYDTEALAHAFQNAVPFPHIAIEEFLDPAFAREVAASYPSVGAAREQGREFTQLNEKGKIQITDAEAFPDPVKKLNELVSAPAFLNDLSKITGIDNLIYDNALAGGGMHLTGARGRLDVHVDFNYHEESQLHRRLNILIYLNEHWPDDWGGAVELWDEKVEVRHHAFKPLLNRCVLFETSQRSFHGVEPVTCPEGERRISFAAYYYTREAPEGWDGRKNDTIFRARPDEQLRGRVLMPLQKLRSEGVPRVKGKAKRAVKKLLGRS